MAEKGHQFAEVKSHVEELPGGPKLVKVVFDINEGPKVKVRDIEFIGNDKISDGKLKKKMKETKEQWFLSFITGRGTYQEAKFEEDADKLQEFYREQGYVQARVGTPEIKTLEDSKDKETRWVQLRIPVTEGARYRVGEVKFEGNTVIKTEFLQPLFKLKPGEFYSEKNVRKGFEKAREMYGAGGYFEFTGFPDMEFLEPAEGPVAGPTAADRERHDAAHRRRAVLRQSHHLHRQHDDPRQRDPARDAPRRRRRVQHRSAQVQRPAAEPARILPEPREVARTAVDVQKTPTEKNQVDVTLEAGGAEPQPADLRRRRLAVRRVLRPAVVPDLELPRPRRVAHAVAAGRVSRARTIRSPSPSRSCSTATSPVASTSSGAACSTSTSSRRNRPAATSCSASRWRTSRGCS